MKNVFTRQLLALLAAATAATPVARADEAVRAEKVVVIAGHSVASQMGLKVLHDGGNAIDALVTVSLALGVAEPGNSGLGGKFVMTYYDATSKRVHSVVAMDAAPKQLPVETVLSADDAARSRGWGAACVPGLASALGESHAKWGSRPWKSLVMPAVQLAERGVELSPTAADMLSEFPAKTASASAMKIYAPGGKILSAGQTLKNPDLAATMRAMADGGWRAFYTGPVADKFVDASRAGGGYFSLEDFEGYHARFLPSLTGTYRGLTVCSSPPPLTGGTTLLASLKCLESTDLKQTRPRDVAYVDTVARVLRQVYPATAAAAADVPDSADRVAKVLSPAGIAAMVEKMKADGGKKNVAARADGPLSTLPGGEGTQDDSPDACTTHLIIVDAAGNVACVTQSLGLHFGGGVVADGTGVLLNADVGNFGFTKTSPNMIAPGKWPRSTMTPTIYLKNGKPVLAIGSPAGQRIPTAVLQVSLDVLDFGRDLREAIRAPRFHVVRGKDNKHIDLEAAAPAGMETTLTELGYEAVRRKAKDYYFGSVNAVQWKADGTLVGVADQRRTSDAAAE